MLGRATLFGAVDGERRGVTVQESAGVTLKAGGGSSPIRERLLQRSDGRVDLGKDWERHGERRKERKVGRVVARV